MNDKTLDIPLRNPGVAAVLAWLCPGAGHLYQQRYVKGVLFMVCILGSYLCGLVLGDGHVVYASWTKTDKRWQFICQAGIGLPALPALLQAHRQKKGDPPLWGGFMSPPRQPVNPEGYDQLASWHERLGANFELGTLYTMVAGLLNILAIYDAYSGPFLPAGELDEEPAGGEDRKRRRRRA